MSYSPRFSWLASFAMLVSLSALSTTSAEAQFGKRLKDAVKRTAEDKAIQKATEEESKAIDSALNGGNEPARPAATETSPGETKPEAPGATAGATPAAGGEAGGAPAAELKPGEGAWANYDFKPGERILYADDFTSDEVGDFPKKMEFKTGAAEIVEWNGSRWLRATNTSRFYLVLPDTLPERFTMEFDYANPSGEVWISFVDENKRVELSGRGAAELYNSAAGIAAQGSYGGEEDPNKIRRARIMADGKYLKVYYDDKRILNVPNADVGRSNKVLFNTDGTADRPAMFGNFRVAAGGKKLYDALAEKGRVATQGIFFDTGSDRIRPESTPTLKEIGTMLKEHPELKLVIEGHTDNVGKPEANQALSEKRANAVRQHLVTTYQIDGTRLQAKGLGQTKPVTGNDTPEGRQNNRRVELVKS
jgi:outer membrane protein OmpA-like peptidoglycan-associated protein